jgi:mRNA interferase RelE/StbE
VAHEVVLTETVVETLEQFETEDAERIINKLEDVGDFRLLIDWDKDNETLYAIDAFERKKEYRELGKYREVWGVSSYFQSPPSNPRRGGGRSGFAQRASSRTTRRVARGRV